MNELTATLLLIVACSVFGYTLHKLLNWLEFKREQRLYGRIK